MARSVQWRLKRPEALLVRTEEALSRTLYIVQQAGPTSFLLREEEREKKFKVSCNLSLCKYTLSTVTVLQTSLGDPHQCSCSEFRRERELCVHILWYNTYCIATVYVNAEMKA